ncbi:TolC family protein [Dysgonomonas sp. ZJ279]|uniref:TolC family protein n=1 Tax=Dysgonomonas sp. ZJ279 TaxID=2709796 RepID=UPI0013EC2557|nr:TolC family protein [Dysgonomonas sp. ZJ279]
MRYIYIIVLILISQTGKAQEKEWTLEECMQYAVENSLEKRKQEAQNTIYHQNYLEAIGRLLPSINANTNANFNFGRGLDSETNTYTDVNSFSNNYNLYSSLILFDGLTSITRVRLQRVNKLMGRQQLEAVKDLIAYETMECFFNVLYSTELVRLAEAQLEESTETLKQITRMAELGVKSYPDVAEISAQEAENNYNLTRQKNILAIAVIKLKEKMNFPIEDVLHVSDSATTPLIVKSQDTAISIFEQSRLFIPKAVAAESKLKSQKLAYKSAKGVLFPTLSVDGGYNTNFSRYMDGSNYSSFNEQFRNKVGRYVGFTLSIPIFNGFSRSAQVRRGKAEVVMAQAERDKTLRTLHSEIEQAVADMNGEADQYYQAKKQVDAMDIAHQVNQRKYIEGLINALDLHITANRLLQARAEELNSKLRFQLKHKLVEYYKGEPFIIINE